MVSCPLSPSCTSKERVRLLTRGRHSGCSCFQQSRGTLRLNAKWLIFTSREFVSGKTFKKQPSDSGLLSGRVGWGHRTSITRCLMPSRLGTSSALGATVIGSRASSQRHGRKGEPMSGNAQCMCVQVFQPALPATQEPHSESK